MAETRFTNRFRELEEQRRDRNERRAALFREWAEARGMPAPAEPQPGPQLDPQRVVRLDADGDVFLIAHPNAPINDILDREARAITDRELFHVVYHRDVAFPHTPTSAAEAKARDLLYKNLTPEQQREADRWHYFSVRGGRTGWRYRVPTLRGSFVMVAADFSGPEYGAVPYGRGPYGETEWPVCVFIPGVPGCDSALGLKWHIEFMEGAFWRRLWGGHTPPGYKRAVRGREEGIDTIPW